MAKKRANGEGCIRKRKDSRWEARYTDIFEFNPKKRRKSIMGKSRKEVSDKLVVALYDMQQGKGLPAGATRTVGDWFEEWMTVYGIIAYKDTTYANYRTIIEAHIKPHVGGVRLFQLETIHIQKMFNALYLNGNRKTKAPLAAATLYKIRNVLSKGLQQAVTNKLISDNPIKNLVLPSLNISEIKVFTINELHLLVKALSRNSFGILIAVLLTTGLRIGELLALELSDIDFNQKFLTINKTVSHSPNKLTGKFEFIVRSPKSNNGIRRLHIMPNLEALLKKQINYLQTLSSESNILFPSNNGSYQTQNAVRKRFVRLQKNVEIIETKNVHSLRHSFVVNALNSGMNIQNLSRIIGHSNGATTLKFYSHYLHTEAYNQLLELDEFHNRFFEMPTH